MGWKAQSWGIEMEDHRSWSQARPEVSPWASVYTTHGHRADHLAPTSQHKYEVYMGEKMLQDMGGDCTHHVSSASEIQKKKKIFSSKEAR